jgi:predicted O-methyltransferase YrrM
MSRVQTPLTDSLLAYVAEVTLREPEALRKVRESSESHPHASMQIGPEQGQFLHVLARLTGARKAIEVGVFMGYSSSWIALGLQPGGKLIACDVSEEYTAIARQTWREAGVEDRIELRLAPALGTLDALIASGQEGSFDFVFIDADKGDRRRRISERLCGADVIQRRSQLADAIEDEEARRIVHADAAGGDAAILQRLHDALKRALVFLPDADVVARP